MSFDLADAILDNSQFAPPQPALAPSGNVAPPADRKAPVRRRPTTMRKAPAAARTMRPDAPLLKDKNFLRYQFGGAVAVLLAVDGILLFILYLNVRFSVSFLATVGIGTAAALAIQLVVALCEQHIPRLKRFFYRVDMQELWRGARYIVLPLLAIATFFDVLSTASGLRLQIVRSFLGQASASEVGAFQHHPVYNTLWTALGTIIAIAPEPLLVITTLAIIRLLKHRRRAILAK